MDLDDEELKATRMMNGADRKGRADKMEQDIDKIINDLEMALLTDLYGHITTLVKKEDLEHLIKAYKELEESNQEKVKMLTEQNRNLQISYDSLQELFELRKYKNNSIPVSLVEEKIEELNKLLEEDLQDERKVNSNRFIIICQCKNCLQELLERRKQDGRKIYK